MKQIYPRASCFLGFSVMLLIAPIAKAQQVSGIITDFNSFWKSGTFSINPVKPNNSHNLLAFTYNGVQYSTGVNDQELSTRGETFTPTDFFAFPVEGISASIAGNTKWGWGQMKDGVHNGIGSLLRPVFDINTYLSDGVNGLDIGTCIANLPAGNLTFFANNIDPTKIADGIPDILVTQVADPGGATDRYSFVDAAGNLVGNTKNIVFTSIAPVGTWTADFYQPLGFVLTLVPGYTNTDRPLRLWAAELSDFGITAANYQSVYKFRVQLSGQSDVAFASYNNEALQLSTTLPIRLSDFSGKKVNSSIQLSWTSSTEENGDFFTIERNTGNGVYEAIGTVKAAGNSNSTRSYSFTDKRPATGNNFYRLKMTDQDASFTYSQVVKMMANAVANATYLYPNPCVDQVTITHRIATNAKITVVSANGMEVLKTNSSSSTQTKLDVQRLKSGVYHAVWQNGEERVSVSFVKN
ncbi:MAG: T9SS type A sorting domain-containing protein [Chitinophagaceae bacterium]|nr:T9SS type A sorting domain-containing protein [Chitinophagaceae bacterium]